MTNRVLIFCLVLAAACAGNAKPGSIDTVRLVAQEARVMDLEQSYWAAELRHDSVTVDSLLAPEYVSMSSRARGDRSKSQELALLFGGRVHLESYRFSNMRATRIAPDALVLHYLVDQRFTVDGRALCPHSGSMTVWVLRGGHWLRVARTEYAIGSAEATECPKVPA